MAEENPKVTEEPPKPARKAKKVLVDESPAAAQETPPEAAPKPAKKPAKAPAKAAPAKGAKPKERKPASKPAAEKTPVAKAPEKKPAPEKLAPKPKEEEEREKKPAKKPGRVPPKEKRKPAKKEKKPKGKAEKEEEEAEPEEEEEHEARQKPELTEAIRAALRLRRELARRRPRFYRQEWYRYQRLGLKWRKPMGGQSKLRRHLGYRINVVSIGFRGPRPTRGLHPSGFREVLVHTVHDLKGVDPKTQAVRIGGGVGGRKRHAIQEEADGLGIRVLNRREE
jgi:large subunit ribosomal protein L32e